MPLLCRFGIISIFTIAAYSVPALAADSTNPGTGQWGLCGVGFQLPAKPASVRDADAASAADPDEVKLSADAADLEEAGRSKLRGNALMEKGTETLAADKAIYDQDKETLEAIGNVRYWEGEDVYLSGERALADFANDRIVVDNASFVEKASHGRGSASRVEFSGSELIKIAKGTYTTCNPGNADWQLEAHKIHLDRVSDVGTARDVKVMFKGYPIFYSPVLTFPLTDQRKTGFLSPSFRLSGEAGSEVRIPYYINIAPNQDATITARLTTERGAILGGEYRYLLRDWGEGELDVEVVPHDSNRGGPRGLVKFKHRDNQGRLRTDLQYAHVSDRDYFGDLGNSLEVSSTTHLRRRASVDYTATRWWGRARLESFQTVDGSIPGTSRPYKRLPQLLIRGLGAERNRRVNFGYRAEFVHFDREDSITGTRVDLNPYLTFPIRTAGWYFVPRMRLRYTGYSLDGVTAGQASSPSRLLPSVSLDSGMFFEKPVTLFGSRYTHTLEPRAYYLAVPFDDQRDLPIFDTGQFTFNFAQLFREDRFSGADRMGDANQLALAVTSRLLHPSTGQEIARVSLGQLHYFRHRSVTLQPEDTNDTRSTSDFVAEISADIGRAWTVKAGTQWNSRDDRSDKNAINLRYRPDNDRVLNLAYRFVRGTVEQVDSSFRWPWNHNVSLVGRLNYSLADSRILETFGGMEYESCCWAMRLVGRRFLTNERGDYNNGLFLQLELKGLAGVGQRADAFLKRSIPGYRDNF